MSIFDAPPETPLALDNDIFTHLRTKQPYVLKHIQQNLIDSGKLAVITATTLFEARFGIEKSLANKKISAELANTQLQQINILVGQHTIINFNQQAAEIAAYVFARLSNSDRNKHWRDIFIAATAIANNYGLATQNRKDMELISKNLPPDTFLRIAVWKK